MTKSVFRAAYESVLAARERQASRQVNAVMMGFDDKTLKSMGTSREELRRQGTTNYVF